MHNPLSLDSNHSNNSTELSSLTSLVSGAAHSSESSSSFQPNPNNSGGEAHFSLPTSVYHHHIPPAAVVAAPSPNHRLSGSMSSSSGNLSSKTPLVPLVKEATSPFHSNFSASPSPYDSVEQKPTASHQPHSMLTPSMMQIHQSNENNPQDTSTSVAFENIDTLQRHAAAAGEAEECEATAEQPPLVQVTNPSASLLASGDEGSTRRSQHGTVVGGGGRPPATGIVKQSSLPAVNSFSSVLGGCSPAPLPCAPQNNEYFNSANRGSFDSQGSTNSLRSGPHPSSTAALATVQGIQITSLPTPPQAMQPLMQLGSAPSFNVTSSFSWRGLQSGRIGINTSNSMSRLSAALPGPQSATHTPMSSVSSNMKMMTPRYQTNSTPYLQQQQQQSVNKTIYLLLNEYKNRVAETSYLAASIQPFLTVMLMDPDLVTNLDFPSVNNNNHGEEMQHSAFGATVTSSPMSNAIRMQQLKVAKASRADFENFSTDQLIEYCCYSHSCLVLLADLLSATPTQSASNAAAMHSPGDKDTLQFTATSFTNFANPQGQERHGSSRVRVVQTVLPPEEASSFTALHSPRGAARQAHNAVAQALGKDTFMLDNVACTQSVVAPSGSATFVQSLNYNQSILHSVASQFLEPVHETDVALKTRDELGMKMLNNYMMMETLGQGACGKVKLGYDVEKGLSVAIKVIRRTPKGHQRNVLQAKSQSSQADLLQREIAVMKKLRHKNIVSLYEVIDDPEAEKLYLVMQYVDNGPIAKMNRNGTCPPLDVASFVNYARQVCAGLEYLHSHYIVHRDIKPENILVSSNKQAFLADFGVSETFGSLNAEGSTTVKGHRGTPLFMAPEMWKTDDASDGSERYARSPRNVVDSLDSANGKIASSGNKVEEEEEEEALDGFALDVWALGVTFYLLLYGRPPYPDVKVFMGSQPIPPPTFTTAAEELQGVESNSFAASFFAESPKASLTLPIPEELVTLLKRMLDPKPYKRPQISVVRAAIKRIQKGVEASMLQQQPQTGPSSTRRKTRLGDRCELLDAKDIAVALTPKVSSVGVTPHHSSYQFAAARKSLAMLGKRNSIASNANLGSNNSLHSTGFCIPVPGTPRHENNSSSLSPRGISPRARGNMFAVFDPLIEAGSVSPTVPTLVTNVPPTNTPQQQQQQQQPLDIRSSLPPAEVIEATIHKTISTAGPTLMSFDMDRVGKEDHSASLDFWTAEHSRDNNSYSGSRSPHRKSPSHGNEEMSAPLQLRTEGSNVAAAASCDSKAPPPETTDTSLDFLRDSVGNDIQHNDSRRAEGPVMLGQTLGPGSMSPNVKGEGMSSLHRPPASVECIAPSPPSEKCNDHPRGRKHSHTTAYTASFIEGLPTAMTLEGDSPLS